MKHRAAAKLLEEKRSPSEVANFFLAPIQHPDMVMDILIARGQDKGKSRRGRRDKGDDYYIPGLDMGPAGGPPAPTRRFLTLRNALKVMVFLSMVTVISCAIAPNSALYNTENGSGDIIDMGVISAGGSGDGPSVMIEPMEEAVDSAWDSAWKMLAGTDLPEPLAASFAGRLFKGEWSGLFLLDKDGNLKAVAKPESFPMVASWMDRYNHLEDENNVLRETMEALTRVQDSEKIYLELDLTENTIYVKMASKVLHKFPVVTGKGYTPRGGRIRRFQTPRGVMSVIKKEENPVWYPPSWHWTERGQSPPKYRPAIRGVLGTRRLKFPDGYGIHGTSGGRIRPGKYSHGCIRMNKRDIHIVYNMCDVGTELYVY